MENVLGVILGGGVGSRLFPLTRDRTKPAVPLAGKYRLIDIPMSNCLHAGINKIAILTQFNSVSLHRHIQRTYSRDMFTKGFTQILAAEQSHDSKDWYQGTADAIRQQLNEISESGAEYVLILAGDHLYRMDYAAFVQNHIDAGADISIAVQPTNKKDAPSLGIIKLDASAANQIVQFTEKPSVDELDGLESGSDKNKPYMASMGIYIFSTKLLKEMLEANDGTDFGKHIIPQAIDTHRVMGYVFDGYWEDIGTMRRFYEVNLNMASELPDFNLYDQKRPIYSRPRFLPSSKVQGGNLQNCLLADGCRITEATILHAVIGLRSIISNSVTIRRTIMMGADYYQSLQEIEEDRALGRPHIGVGRECVIEAAILDKNARIGNGVIIRDIPDRADETHENWVSRDGIVIVPKNAIIEDNMVI